METEKMNAQRINQHKAVFFNRKGFEVLNNTFRENILRNIRDIGNYSISSKYYNFLNKRNLGEIRGSDFRVSLSSYGKKFILFLTIYDGKKKCILINKKNEMMIESPYYFDMDLFEGGTLLDGEVVKNENNKWIFIINDIAYYKGESLIIKSFEERQVLIDNMLENQIDRVREDISMTYITKKIYFNYNNLQDMCGRFKDSLSYKSSGIYFKNINNYSDNYLYMFPDCRTDYQVLHSDEVLKENNISNKIDVGVSVQKVEEVKKVDNVESDDIFGDVEVEIVRSVEVTKRIESCKFLIKPTLKPDVYELYCRSVNNHIERYAVAGIQNMETSRFLKDLTKELDINNNDISTMMNNGKAIYVECLYNKILKKWIPVKKSDGMDHHAHINKVQILLDNRKDDSDSSDDEDEDELEG